MMSWLWLNLSVELGIATLKPILPFIILANNCIQTKTFPRTDYKPFPNSNTYIHLGNLIFRHAEQLVLPGFSFEGPCLLCFLWNLF